VCTKKLFNNLRKGVDMDNEPSVATFVDVEDSTTTALTRHNLMVGKTDAEIATITKELEIDLELGLKKQAELTVVKALNHDIDDLTSSNNYFEVTKDLLDKLFQIKKLRAKCFWTNIMSRISGFFKAGALPLSLHALALALIYPLLRFSMWVWPVSVKGPTAFLVTACILNCFFWIGLVVLIVIGFTNWSNQVIEYTSLDVNVESELLSKVSEKIPYGAKLKVLEAKNTGIFNDFVYVAPEFRVTKGEHRISFPQVDPAILGVAPDNRRYMIVYWDIDKDIARVIKEIEHFKKYKLNKNI
jgi:hypothetical protein